MKKSISVVMFALCLTACGDPSVEDLVENPELLKETLEECSEMSQNDVADSELCARASNAMMQNMQKDAAKMMKELMGK